MVYAGRVSLVNELLSAAKCEPAMAGPLWAANSAPKLDKAATKLKREEMAAAISGVIDWPRSALLPARVGAVRRG